MTESLVADVAEGDVLTLSQYISQVTVTERVFLPTGPVLLVESSGGTTYRLRAIDDDDDRLLLEKPSGDGRWVRHCRVEAERADD